MGGGWIQGNVVRRKPSKQSTACQVLLKLLLYGWNKEGVSEIALDKKAEKSTS